MEACRTELRQSGFRISQGYCANLPLALPFRLNFDPLVHLRITILQQRWAACRGYVSTNVGFGEGSSKVSAPAFRLLRV